MGAVKAAMFDQESVAMLGVLRERSAYRDMAFQMQKALEAIRDMTPESVAEPNDVYGRVMCYHEAKKIARDTLRALSGEYGDGSL